MGGRIYLDSRAYNKESLWNPRIIFVNLEQVEVERVQSIMLLQDDVAQKKGYNVRPALEQRLQFTSHMNSQRYPFDTQYLQMHIMSFS